MTEYPWLEAERIYSETHTHLDISEREIANLFERGWAKQHIMELDSYSGHKYFGVFIKSKRVTVEIKHQERGSKSFSLPRLLGEAVHRAYQPALFAAAAGV